MCVRVRVRLSQGLDLAQLRLKHEEATAELARRERHLTVARQQVSEAKSAELETAQRNDWLSKELARQVRARNRATCSRASRRQPAKQRESIAREGNARATARKNQRADQRLK
eukprot:6172881-Pleurochrysis_carterae.AAC.1